MGVSYCINATLILGRAWQGKEYIVRERRIWNKLLNKLLDRKKQKIISKKKPRLVYYRK
jgi:hypothetical protein